MVHHDIIREMKGSEISFTFTTESACEFTAEKAAADDRNRFHLARDGLESAEIINVAEESDVLLNVLRSAGQCRH